MTEPQMIPPQPVPTMVNVGQVQGADGGMLAMLQFSTPTGMNVFFLDPATARRIGDTLITLGQASSLLIAPAGAIPTGRH